MRLSSLLVPATIAGTTLAFAPFVALAFLAVPTADDYCYAVLRTKMGVFDATAHLYSEAQGRYVNHLFFSSVASPDNLMSRYFLFPITIMAIAFGALVFLFHRLLGSGTSPLFRFGLPAVVLLTVLTRVPEPGQTIYWLAGASGYFLGGAVFVAALAALIPWLEGWRQGMRAALWTLPLGLVLVALGSGLHEQYGFALLALIGGVFLTGLCLRWRRDELALPLLLGVWAAAALAVVVMSPGHMSRLDVSTEGASTLMLVLQAMKGLLYTVVMVPYLSVTWSSDLLVLVTALTIVFVASATHEGQPSDHRRGGSLAQAVGLWCAALGAAYPAVTTIGVAFSGRSEFPVYLTSLLAVLATARAFAPQVRALLPPRLLQAPPTLLLVFAVALTVCSPRFLDAVLDLRDHGTYATQIGSILEISRQRVLEGDRHLEVSGLPSPPALIHSFDIKEWTHHWVNWCLADFLEAETVRRAPTPPVPAEHWAVDARIFDLKALDLGASE